MSFYRLQPDLTFEALRQHAVRSKQKDKETEDGSKRVEPQLPSHTSAVGKKEPSEQYNIAEKADGGEGGVSGGGREEGEPSVVKGVEGAPISSPAWTLMAKALAR